MCRARQGLLRKASSSKFKVQSSKFKVQSSKFKVQSSKFRVQSSEFRVQSSEFVEELTSARRSIGPSRLRLLRSLRRFFLSLLFFVSRFGVDHDRGEDRRYLASFVLQANDPVVMSEAAARDESKASPRFFRFAQRNFHLRDEVARAGCFVGFFQVVRRGRRSLD
jgi:hypothetical protein